MNLLDSLKQKYAQRLGDLSMRISSQSNAQPTQPTLQQRYEQSISEANSPISKFWLGEGGQNLVDIQQHPIQSLGKFLSGKLNLSNNIQQAAEANQYNPNKLSRNALNVAMYPIRAGAGVVQGLRDVGAGSVKLGTDIVTPREIGKDLLNVGLSGLNTLGSEWSLTPGGVGINAAINSVAGLSNKDSGGSTLDKITRGIGLGYGPSEALNIDREKHPFIAGAVDLATYIIAQKGVEGTKKAFDLRNALNKAGSGDYTALDYVIKKYPKDFKDLNIFKKNMENKSNYFLPETNSMDMAFQNMHTGEARSIPSNLGGVAKEMDSVGKAGDWHVSAMQPGTLAKNMSKEGWGLNGSVNEEFLRNLPIGESQAVRENNLDKVIRAPTELVAKEVITKSKARGLEQVKNNLSQNLLDQKISQKVPSSENIIPRNLFGEIQSNAVSIEATPKTLEKIAKQEKINILKEKKANYNKAVKIISKNLEDNTTGAVAKEIKPVEANIALSGNWKDKPKLLLKRETMSRNFDDVMGKDAPAMKETFLDPIGKSEAERVRFLNKERTDIKGLGIKAGSNESKLLQQYGEGKVTLENLKKQTPDWQKIVSAEKVFRQKYDAYLSKINTILVKNGYDPIPRRNDYFTHFNDVGNVLENFGIPVKADLLPTDINGLTADFKPGKNFFTSALERKGDMTKFDAVAGIDRYLNGASKLIFMTDNIQRLRMLEKTLRDQHAGTTQLTNFTADLGEYINNLAGKKSMLDRGVEDLLGRGIYGGANALKRQVGANAVGGNVSSALTNFIPLTQSLATTDKTSFAKGMLQTLLGVGKDDGFINKSDFLTRRYGSDPLSIKLWEKIGNKASWLFRTIDKFTSETIVRAKYLEGLKKGLSDTVAMKYADDWAAKIIADRSVGQIPTLFNSKTAGFLTQFQLEVNNQLSFIGKDIPRNFSKPAAASAIAQVFLYGYLYNQIYEKLTGRRPALDPIGWAKKAYQDSKNPNISTQQALKNVGGDITNQLPFVSTFTGGRVPISNALPNIGNIYKDVTKEDGPDFAGVGNEMIKPAINLLPTGGSQIKKTIQGVSAYNKGYVGSPDAVKFPVDKNIPNFLRMATFGQYSTPESSQYFREGNTPLSGTQSSLVISTDKDSAYKTILKGRQDNKLINKALKNMEKGKGAESTTGNLPTGIVSVGGKYATLIGDDAKTFPTVEEAQLAQRKYTFDQSGKKFQQDKDYVFTKNKLGSVSVEPIEDYTYKLNVAKLTDLYNRGDTEEWIKLASQQTQTLLEQYKVAEDPLEKERLGNDFVALQTRINKYKSYGGFKKPKKPKKISVSGLKTGVRKVTGLKVGRFKAGVKKIKKIKLA